MLVKLPTESQHRENKDDWVPEKKKPPAVIEKKNKPKTQPRPKASSQVIVDNRDMGEGAGNWNTVDKVAKKKNTSLKVTINKTDPSNTFEEYRPNTRAQAPVVVTEAERRQQRNAAKKAAKELERKRNAANAEALKKLESHADPSEGFTTVKKGAKVQKVKTDLDQFGSQTAFGKLQKGPQHMKVPKAQKQRKVETMTDEQRQELLLKHQQELTGKPTDLEVTFNVEVQGKWYNIADLLAASDFEHAPKFVTACVNQKRVMGGYFIASDGKFFSNSSTVDEWWMATSSYLNGFTKLLNDLDTAVNITPYWTGDNMADKGKDATATFSVKKPTLQEGCFPQFTLTHNQKQGAQLQSVTGSIHQFAEVWLSLFFCTLFSIITKKNKTTKNSRYWPRQLN